MQFTGKNGGFWFCLVFFFNLEGAIAASCHGEPCCILRYSSALAEGWKSGQRTQASTEATRGKPQARHDYIRNSRRLTKLKKIIIIKRCGRKSRRVGRICCVSPKTNTAGDKRLLRSGQGLRGRGWEGGGSPSAARGGRGPAGKERWR